MKHLAYDIKPKDVQCLQQAQQYIENIIGWQHANYCMTFKHGRMDHSANIICYITPQITFVPLYSIYNHEHSH